MAFDPDILRLGKEFGVEVQTEYPAGADGVTARPEHVVPRGSGRAFWLEDGSKVEPRGARLGRRGRMDLLLEGLDEESGLPFKVVLEVKRTDWDGRAEHRVVPNLGAHRRQVWSYLEPLIEEVDAGTLAWAQAALVYPRRPTTPDRADRIETNLGEYGISVLWYDELDG